MNIQSKIQIKVLLAQKGIKQKNLAIKLSEITGKTYSQYSFSHKLSRGKLTYDEMLLIAEILGFDIEFINNNNELI